MAITPEDQTIQLTLTGTSNAVVNATLSTNTESTVEAEVLHTGPTFSLTVAFGTFGQTCRRLLQDVSLYVEECHSFCGSNLCPASPPYFKLANAAECVADCPAGYTESGNDCVPTQMCHSTCDTCALENNAAQCSTCATTLSATTSLTFTSPATPPGPCTLPATNNAQLLLTVNKDTVLGTSALKSVTYNSVAQSGSGSALSALTGLYVLNVIDFSTLSSNSVVFSFDVIGPHQKLLVRARVLTECDPAAATPQDNTVKMILSAMAGATNVEVPQTLTMNDESIVEGAVVHNQTAFSVTIEFGTQGQTCRRMVQDVSIYFERCEHQCLSTNCPVVLPHYKLSNANTCVSDCPDGYF